MSGMSRRAGIRASDMREDGLTSMRKERRSGLGEQRRFDRLPSFASG